LGSNKITSKKNDVQAFIITQELLIYELDSSATPEKVKQFTDDFLKNKLDAKNNEKKAELSEINDMMTGVSPFKTDMKVHE
jgi:hypothetical protein